MSLVHFGIDRHAVANTPAPMPKVDVPFFTVGADSSLSAPEMARLKYIFVIGAGLGFAAGIALMKLKYMFILGIGAGIAAGAAMRQP